MKKASVAFDVVRDQLMVNEEFKKEYDKLGSRYQIISDIISARKEQNITQEKLVLKT